MKGKSNKSKKILITKVSLNVSEQNRRAGFWTALKRKLRKTANTRKFVQKTSCVCVACTSTNARLRRKSRRFWKQKRRCRPPEETWKKWRKPEKLFFWKKKEEKGKRMLRETSAAVLLRTYIIFFFCFDLRRSIKTCINICVSVFFHDARAVRAGGEFTQFP